MIIDIIDGTGNTKKGPICIIVVIKSLSTVFHLSYMHHVASNLKEDEGFPAFSCWFPVNATAGIIKVM